MRALLVLEQGCLSMVDPNEEESNGASTTSLSPPTSAVAATTPLHHPSKGPSRVPSLVVEPSDLPSAQPTWDRLELSKTSGGGPSTSPTSLPPKETPSVRQTGSPTTTFSAGTVQRKTGAPVSQVNNKEECHLEGCYLRNQHTGVETPLDVTLPTSYPVLHGSSSAARYSIRCVTSDKVEFIDFFLGKDEAASTIYHREYVMPFWMQSNNENWIEPVPYLSVCDQTSTKIVRVAAAVTDEVYCVDVSFPLIAYCKDEESLLDSTISPVAAVPSFAESSNEGMMSDSGPDNKNCMMQCYLHDIDTSEEMMLRENQITTYSIAADGSSRYSIRCDTKGDGTGIAEHVDFFYNRLIHQEYNAPYWMQSNSADWIEPAEYLSVCDGSGAKLFG